MLRTNINGFWWLAFKTELFLFSLGDEIIEKDYMGNFEISALDFVQIRFWGKHFLSKKLNTAF